MEFWQILVVIGMLFIAIEMFAPTLFFLNFALASFFTAIVAFFIFDWNILVPIFVISSALFLLFLRPFLVRAHTQRQKTGIEGKYIGNIAKVTELITSERGVISIYDERWNARCVSGEEIPVGAMVKIVRNENLIFHVEKI